MKTVSDERLNEMIEGIRLFENYNELRSALVELRAYREADESRERYEEKPAPKTEKVFDWDKAAKLIKKYGVDEAWLCLAEDTDTTTGKIFENYRPIKEHVNGFWISYWATPVLYLPITYNEVKKEDWPLVIEDDRGEWCFECYTTSDKHSDWADDTLVWPESALKILDDKSHAEK